MTYNFDEILDRRKSESLKWHCYDEDVLPMWVADMDFRSPETVVRALQERVAEGVFGYPQEPPELTELIVERMQNRYGWKIAKEDVLLAPGVVVGFNWAAHAMTRAGEGILIQTPVYPPFFNASENAGLLRQEMELTLQADGSYAIDFDRFEQAITSETRMFLLCNPHNPVGRVFTYEELSRMAEICLKHKVGICSDEIHSDLLFSGTQHIPIASLNPEIAMNTLTIIAPSKTFNIAGLECSALIVQNPEIRENLKKAKLGLVGHINLMGLIAALEAYRSGQAWLDELLVYLQSNRDFLFKTVNEELPGIHMAKPEATYLAWLDCREANLPGTAGDFFAKQARVGMNEGELFGKGGEGFVRMNFGCPRSMLVEALERMKKALPK